MLLSPQTLTQLGSLELKARQIVEGFISGLHRSPFYGFSIEFAEHRPYQRGDEIKHIDWKIYGKREKYFVKQYEEETNLRCYLLLDVSSSMQFKHFGDWPKLKYAAHFGAAMLYLMHRQRDACGLITFDDQIREFYPAKSSYSHLRHLFTRLEPLAAEDPADTEKRKTASSEVLHEVSERLPRRSLIVILSDLFENVQHHEDLLKSLKHLRHRQHEVILFNTLEKRSERDLDFPDRRFTFSDLETGEKMDILPRQIRNDYRKKMQEYIHQFKLAGSEARIDFEELDTEAPFDKGLLAYLTKRKRLL